MESNPLATRTYTALTCKLIVSMAIEPRAGLGWRSQRSDLGQQSPVDFTLHLDHPDRGESERITIYGQFHQLDRLQQVVSKYITELVAKFPIENMQNHSSSDSRSTSAVDPATAIDSKLDSNDSQANQSGLMNNLPGLRKSASQSKVANDLEAQSDPVAESGISRLFGGWNKQPSRKKSQTKQPHTPLGAAASVTVGQQQTVPAPSQPDQSATTPYLTGSERSLDRQLHLGDLANTTSGDTIVLSPSQLFDLSNVLDEYAVAETTTNPPTESVTFSRANIPASSDRHADLDTATASLSRLPNLPKTSGGLPTPPSNQVYNRTRTNHRSRPSVSWMSVVPWVAAAAVAVGLPTAIFSSKPNPIKDAANKVKMPNMAGVKKTVVAAMSPPIVDPEPTTTNSSPATNPNLPKPWATQPVNPPIGTGTSPLPVNTGTQPIQSDSKPGLAPLPPSLNGQPGQNLTGDANRSGITNILPRNGARSGIAPNPLSAPIPTAGNNIGLPSSRPDLTSTSPTTATMPSKATGLQRSQLSPTIAPRTVSVSTQPILLPSDLPGIGIAPPTATEMPGNSAQTSPVATKPPTSKKVKRKVKPLVAAKTAKPQAAQPAAAGAVSQPLFEQSPAIPNVVNPVQTPVSEGNDVQNLPIAPVQPVTANPGENLPGEVTDNPSLQQTKRYFQAKWKASSTQANPLQYVVQINGKSGLVRNVAPQDEAATTYLNQTNLIKPGQKLATPAPGATDQKIRVILQPDGNVDTFVEP